MTIFILTLFLIISILSFFGYQRLAQSVVFPNVELEVRSDFLSNAYFTELQAHYERIRSEHREFAIVDHAKAIASHAILTQMMTDLRENPGILYGHELYEAYFDTFDNHIRQLPYVTKELHYFRNELNRYGEAPDRLEDMIELAARGQWRLFSARYHRYEASEYDAAYNVKFISDNGRFEAVYNIQTGQIVTDPVNMGTYNYAPGSIHPWKYYQHHQYDKVPWMKWGNTEQVSYEEIKRRPSRHGSIEQKDSSEELEKLIELRKM